MRDVLISIRPEYAEGILNGTKKYEFRRVWPVGEQFTLWIYASSPLRRLIGTAEVSGVVRGAKSKIWSTAKDDAGISKTALFDYFEGCDSCKALSLVNAHRFAKPLVPTELFSTFLAPQSFRYLSEDEVRVIKKAASHRRKK